MRYIFAAAQVTAAIVDTIRNIEKNICQSDGEDTPRRSTIVAGVKKGIADSVNAIAPSGFWITAGAVKTGSMVKIDIRRVKLLVDSLSVASAPPMA